MAKKNKGISSRGYRISQRQINLFPKSSSASRLSISRFRNGRYKTFRTRIHGTNFLTETGHVSSEFRPMAMKRGGFYNQYRNFFDKKGNLKTTRTSWTTKPGRKGGGTLTLTTFMQHLRIAAYSIEKNAINFAVVLSLRAQEIFRKSLERKQFYSASGKRWKELSEKTIKKRVKLKTWPKSNTWQGPGGALTEFGDMYWSIKQKKTGTGAMVYTDPSEYKEHTYANGRTRRTICYAGIHNSNRQFIGHSTYLFDFANTIIGKYLFDDVFVNIKSA